MKSGRYTSLLHVPLGLLIVAAALGSANQGFSTDGGATVLESGYRQAAPAGDRLRDAGSPNVDIEAVPALKIGLAFATNEATEADAAQAASDAGGATTAAGKLQTTAYTVQPGDSLADIASQFGIDVPTLLGSNDLDDPDLLPTGRQLTILPVRGVLYEVADGDTLNRIAQRYALPVLAIMRANGMDDSELIRLGQALVLPGAKPLFARVPVRQPAELAPATRVEPPRVELAAALIVPGPVATRPGFVWPSSGPITTYFGEVGYTSPRGHAGLDIAAPWGAPVRAAAGGAVIVATRNGGPYGIQVILDHGNGLRTVYGHLSELHVIAGEQVERGDRLGLVGSTGYSTGPHLHFEIRQNGELRDPMKLLP